MNADFGLLVTWVLTCDRSPGRKSLNAAVDLPFASPTAVADIALAAFYAPNGWIGSHAAFAPGDPVSLRMAGGRPEVPGGMPGGRAVHARTWPPGGRVPRPGRLPPARSRARAAASGLPGDAARRMDLTQRRPRCGSNVRAARRRRRGT